MAQTDKKKKTQKKQVYLNKYQEVLHNSATWGRIQYMLQMAYANVSIVLKKLYVVGNQGMETKFYNNNENKKSIEVIVSENQLNKAEDFNTICDKGFKDILNIEYGKLQLNKVKKQGQDIHEVMICQSAIGKTYIEKIKSYTQTVPFQEKPQLMSEDFDSVFIYDQNANNTEFNQKYIIYDPQTKCLPEFIAHFIVDHQRYRQLQEKIICQLCDDNIARKYCETEDYYFCISCDNTHHQNKLAYKHKRTDLTEKPKVLGYCDQHVTLKMELFCLECSRPICINCKVKGDHSEGQNLTHTLVRITQKYQQTGKLLQQSDPLLENKKKILNNQLKLIDTKLKEINKKNVQLQDKIYEMMESALKQLQKITKQKLALLMTDHLELKRQLDEIKWIENYIRYEYKILTPNDFLLSYARYNDRKDKIIIEKFQPLKVMPDMSIIGNINIITEQESRNKQQQGLLKKQIHHNEIAQTGIFRKAEEKNANIMKSKLPKNQGQLLGNKELLTHKNNLLNLSILKNI